MSSSSTTPKFRVAICGAGIGGLALAVTIGKYAERNVHIDIYEAHDAITTAGAGISISPRATEIMQELGMYEEILRVSTKPSSSGSMFRKSDIREGGFEWFRQVFKHFGLSGMHRQHLVDIFNGHLPASCTVHFNKRLTTYDRQPAGLLVLHFADDSTVTTDVLIGADGIRSSVRKTLFETIDRGVIDPSKIRHYTDASWTGMFVYRILFPAEELLKIDPNHICLKNFVAFCGKGKHIVSYLISQGTLVNIVAYVSDEQNAGKPFEGRWVSGVSREELEEVYQDFEPAVKNFLKCCENPSRWAVHVVNDLPLATWDRVALMGDACHAMTPHLGAGASQAIEDAFVLGRLLAHPLTTLDNVHVALKAYQDVRLLSAQSVARISEHRGDLLQFNAPGYYDGTDRGNEQEELKLLREKILNQPSWKGSAVAEWLKAERILQENLIQS